MKLRTYQQQAVESVYEFLRTRDDNPCVVIPTGGGKTPVIATICRDAVNVWGGRVLVLAHVKELLEQATEKLEAIAPDLDVGVYSAGLKRRDTQHPVIVAGVQSIYRRACELDGFDLIIIDEAHMIPPDGDGMYRQFLADARVVNPDVRVIGLTATPYRMKSGMICSPGGILNEVCYEIGVKELIVQGYLCPLRTKAGLRTPDTDGLHVRAGEFVAGEAEDLMDADDLVESACTEIIEHTVDRKAVLIFSSGVRHGRHICRVLEERHGVECGFVCGETPSNERDEVLGRFRSGSLKYLCNVNVLTTGFDAPHIDCIAMVRPTLSPGLYYQMVGRGFRIDPGKADCLVLDFGGNVIRHGPVDDIRITAPNAGDGEAPAKECPECHALIHAAYSVCPQCGHEFPEREESTHDAQASTEGVLSGQTTRTVQQVQNVFFSVHTKRDAPPDAPRSMRVEYQLGFNDYVSEWICVEHTGYARAKAESWWQSRSNEPTPDSAEEAVALAEAGALAETRSITIKRTVGEKYDRIVDWELGPRPGALPEPEYVYIDDCEVPF
ncbi:MAG: DEAD/DEAH box helicase family protein [Phycisphaerales bacterium]